MKRSPKEWYMENIVYTKSQALSSSRKLLMPPQFHKLNQFPYLRLVLPQESKVTVPKLKPVMIFLLLLFIWNSQTPITFLLEYMYSYYSINSYCPLTPTLTLIFYACTSSSCIVYLYPYLLLCKNINKNSVAMLLTYYFHCLMKTLMRLKHHKILCEPCSFELFTIYLR